MRSRNGLATAAPALSSVSRAQRHNPAEPNRPVTMASANQLRRSSARGAAPGLPEGTTVSSDPDARSPMVLSEFGERLRPDRLRQHQY